ncbi:tetratricopeptide (TPR) repeat protein [Bradyrhizobium japonicum]
MVFWHFIWFRYAAYRMALVWRWLVSGWRPHMITLVLVGACLWLVEFGWTVPGTLGWTLIAKMVGDYVLLWLVVWLIVHAYQSRGRFIILPTVNNAGKDFDGVTSVLAPHLATELRQLRGLYKAFDRPNSQTKGDTQLLPRFEIRVDNPRDELANIVGEKSDVKIGPVSVALRPLIATFERSISGQRLSSSLHQIGNRLTLSADIEGTDENYHVERNLPDHATVEDTANVLHEMAEELVYRVSITKAPVGSREWKAVKQFSEGLRAYQRTETTDLDKIRNLREAENHFFEAISLDRTFARCSYNLGTVYRERKKLEKARAAFERAINENPAHADAAYALSLIHMYEPRLQLALEFADRAIVHSPSDVSAWTLRGYIWRQLQSAHTEQAGQNRQQPEQKAKAEETEQSKPAEEINKAKLKNAGAWRANLKYHETAAALAWRDLCCAAARMRPLDAPQELVAISFFHLAGAHLELNNRRRGVRILHQAIRQRPTAELYFQLGKELTAPEEVSRANLGRGLTAYQAAVQFARTNHGRAYLHVFVAETSALLEVREVKQSLRNILFELFIPGRQSERATTARHTALQACDNALASPSIFASPSMFDLPSGKDMLPKLQTVCRKLQDVHRCRVIEHIMETFDTFEPKRGESDPQRLERIVQATKNTLRMSDAPAMVPIIAWKRARFCIEIWELLQKQQDRSDPERIRKPERLLRWAVLRLERHYPAEDCLGSAYERLANAKLLQSEFIDALKFAEKAVALNPFSANRMLQLGLAHWNLANYDQAEQRLRRSYELDPFNAITLANIGIMPFARGEDLTNYEDQRPGRRDAIKFLSQAIDLVEHDGLRAELHFRSAVCHTHLTEYDSAKKQYQIARALGHFPSACYLCLGENDIEQQLFDSADRHLRDALQEILKAKRTALPKARPDSSTNWWRTPQKSAYGSDVPPGYFLLRICLLLALVAAERGSDIARARRKLGFVDRHLKFLGKPQPTAERDELRNFEDRRLDIAARYEDYLGWVCHLDNQPRQAREHLEAAVKKCADSENLYHLARVYLDQSAIDRSEDCCRRARAADMRGVHSTRIAIIEAEISRRRKGDAESPSAAFEGDSREKSQAGSACERHSFGCRN